jgi:phosphoribosylamine-glycine ligase
MKILYFELEEFVWAYCAGLAFKESGHDVSFAFMDNKSVVSTVGKDAGYTYDQDVKGKYDLVVVPDTSDCLNGYADMFRKQGVPVYGINKEAARLEERMFGKKIAEKSGLNMPKWRKFDSSNISESFEFVKELNGKCVVKPEFTTGALLTRVFKNSDDAIDYIKDIGSDFTIEQFIEGIEVAMYCVFSGGKIIPMFMDIEDKNLYGDGMGWQTSIGTVCWFDQSTRFFNEVFLPVVPSLRDLDFRGFVDIATIYSPEDDKFYFLEFTPRFGYPEFPIMLSLFKGDIAEFLKSIAIGEPDVSKINVYYDRIAVGAISVFMGDPRLNMGSRFCRISGIDDIIESQSFDTGFFDMDWRIIKKKGLWYYDSKMPGSSKGSLGCAVSSTSSFKGSIEKCWEINSKVAYKDRMFKKNICPSLVKDAKVMLDAKIISDEVYKMIKG